MSDTANSGPRLSGRKIIITGAASGIGQATAKLFAEAGATLALLDLDVAELSRNAGDGNIAIQVDVSDEASVEKAVAAAEKHLGGIDGIVNAAGVFATGRIEDTSLSMWQKMLTVNLTGPFLVTRAALPFLKAAKSATIVNMGSGSALLPYPELSAYAAAKGGVQMLTKVWAAELGPNIRVNVVCPGMTRTPMVSVWYPDQAALDARAKEIYALQRVAEPDEVGRVILFLTSTDSSFITGATLAVDGGRTYH